MKAGWPAVGPSSLSSLSDPSRPISAMMERARSTLMPGTSASRCTAGRAAASGPVPASGPVAPSASTPQAAGIAVPLLPVYSHDQAAAAGLRYALLTAAVLALAAHGSATTDTIQRNLESTIPR